MDAAEPDPDETQPITPIFLNLTSKLPDRKNTEIITIEMPLLDRGNVQGVAHPMQKLPRKTTWNNHGYVYLLKALWGGRGYKIGATSMNSTIRIQRIRNSVEWDVVKEHTIKCDRPFALELKLHEQYKHKWMFGEWFLLDQEDIAYIKSIKFYADGTIWRNAR